ncbi:MULTISPECIES: hypothetical protein [Streptomycetaceae]|nr:MULTISPECIES: hypothetical protein [Streptomycetaceae]MYS58745.1 hypothetical protein [Streptomyces sp. SID5468]CCB74424.1 protein of unknown function [Streptantibioticus cattleyicolor NRRL 8057 = DSM 46488]
MRKLVEAHEEWEKERQAWFRQIPSYDPVDGDQPCIDAEMGDYEHIEEIYVLDAQEMLVNFASEARKLLEEGK